jgi:hypothetical protein
MCLNELLLLFVLTSCVARVATSENLIVSAQATGMDV